MRHKLVTLVLAVVVITSLVIAGCAKPAPAPAPAPGPAPAPAPAPAPSPAPEKPIELSFSTHVPTTGGKHIRGHAPWAEMVKEATNGRVEVVIYPEGTLSGAKDTYDATINGICDIGWFDAAMEPGRFPLVTDIYSLPGAGISNCEMASVVIWNLYKNMPEIQAEFADTKVLLMHAFAPLSIATTDVPIRTLDDVKGLQIRAAPGGTGKLIDLAGGVAIPMPPKDIYVSMEQGILDGNAMGWEGHGAFRIVELAKYFTPVPAFGGPQFVVVMNQEKWDSLPADIQQAILSVSGDVGARHYGQGDDATSQIVIDEILEFGGEIITLSQEEQEKWNTLAKPLQDEILDKLDAEGLPAREVWNELLRLVKEYNA
jgi:TRAP-type C4-dicarboxylate transport system substrate-binding protein